MNMFDMSEAEREKVKKKQQIVRNEFETVGKYDMPLIKKQFDFARIFRANNFHLTK